LYMDAGTNVLKPLDDVFSHIVNNDYLLMDCGVDIAWQTTKYVINKFDLDAPERRWILDKSTLGIDAGMQGLTRNMLKSYVMPMYECVRDDFRAFEDDGTTPNGFGTGRHDQTLFSVYARLLGLNVLIIDNKNGDMTNLTTLDGRTVPVHITWMTDHVNDKTVIWHSRGGGAHLKSCIRYK
jgi:hypothetical protein